MDYFNEESLELALNTDYSAPVFKPVQGKSWVPFLDNDKTQYPDKLLSYYNNCALHGAIVRSIGRQFAGNGFTYDTSTNKSNKTAEFLGNINQYGEDANDVLIKTALDLAISNSFALAVVWSKDYKTIIGVEQIDWSKLRATPVNDKGKVEGYFYSFNWNTQRPNTIFIPAYSEEVAKEQAAKYEQLKADFDLDPKNIDALTEFFQQPTVQILYDKPYEPGSFYYAHPTYVGATNAIITDILTDQYGVNSMENGLSVNYIVKFIGTYDENAKKKEAQAFLKQHAGALKKGKPIIAFSPDKDSMMSVDNISGINEDKNYAQVNQNAQQKILAGHGITSPLLVGIKTEGQLGGSQELADAERLFYKSVIRPGQNRLTKTFNRIMRVNGLEEVSIERLKMFQDPNEIEKVE